MFIYSIIFTIVFILNIYSFFLKKKEINSTIYLDIHDIYKLDENKKQNEKEFYEFICENINIDDFKFKFYDIIEKYNLYISNKIIYDRSFEIPNGEIFKYIFNHQSCQMLLYEGIFCEINLQNIKIPLHIILPST